MGKFFTFHCKNCGHNLKFYFGIGGMYPQTYQEVLNDAIVGNLGAEIQKFLIENPKGVIDVSRVLAVCNNCGHSKMVRDLTMYLPKENFSPQNDYPLPDDFENNYCAVKKYQHKCGYCGEDVEIITEKNFLQTEIHLPCPNCNFEMTKRKSSGGHWD